MRVEELEITIKFYREIEDGAEVNEAGKDHLRSEVVSVEGAESISVPLHHHIEDKMDIKPRLYNVDHHKLIAQWEDSE